MYTTSSYMRNECPSGRIRQHHVVTVIALFNAIVTIDSETVKKYFSTISLYTIHFILENT